MKIVLFSNSDWFMYNFNRSLAAAIVAAGHDVVLVTPAGEYASRLSSLGFRCIEAPLNRRSLNPLRELTFMLWLCRVLRRERPEIIHSFTLKCAIYGSVAARITGGNRVNAVTGLGFVFASESPLARLLRPFVRGLLSLTLNGASSRVVVLNSDDLNFFIGDLRFRPDRVRLLPGAGVNLKRFSPEPQLRSSNHTRVLLAARMLWDKGVAEFVDAARELRGKHAEVSFILAGSPDPGNPNAIPQRVIEQWVAEGHVVWLGHVDDMPSLLRSVDIAVLPSYREGLPTGLTEAAACELPLVTTDVPGCRDVVTHGLDGLLVPAKDSGALASAILRLHRDPVFRQQLGRAARKKAVDLFGEDEVNKRTLRMYEEFGGSP